jgi:hypothetical protein
VRIGWLSDPSEYTGGAELTQAEFRAAAPEGVEVIDCPPRGIVPCDRYVVHNHLTYTAKDLLNMRGEVIRYHHDMRPQNIVGDRSIFCSPIQQNRIGDRGRLVPPPVDLSSFRPTRQQRRNPKRQGTCCVGAFMNPGKGGHLVSEWANQNEAVDVYGFGPFQPVGQNINNCGAYEQHQLPTILSRYERFVFLPVAIEPFGRCVIEAWASGCQVVTNELVGARYWIEKAPEKLESAAEDFWSVVLA